MPVGFTYQLFTNYQTYFQTGVSMLDYKVHCTYNNVNVKIQYNAWFCAKKVPKKNGCPFKHQQAKIYRSQ